MDDREKCATCRFFDGAGAIEAGRCRRYPPVMAIGRPANGVMGQQESYSTWPYTEKRYWCGDYTVTQRQDKQP